MKKILLGACALMAVATLSCCKNGSCERAGANDSISASYGEYVGAMISQNFAAYAGGEDNKDGKQEFLRGMQMVLGADANNNTQMGMQVGIQMMNELRQFSEQGIEVDKVAVMNAFKKMFLTDSLSYSDAQVFYNRFQSAYSAAQKEIAEAKEAEKQQAPDAVDNVKAGEDFVASLKAENPAAKTTDSGLTYVIVEEGEGAHPGEDATVKVHYTGRHLNGEVFDSSVERGEPATFNLQGVVPGFAEGIRLLGKGGKATIYIPGNLGYGVNGAPGAGIGPNEMLVFDVELLDVE